MRLFKTVYSSILHVVDTMTGKKYIVRGVNDNMATMNLQIEGSGTGTIVDAFSECFEPALILNGDYVLTSVLRNGTYNVEPCKITARIDENDRIKYALETVIVDEDHPIMNFTKFKEETTFFAMQGIGNADSIVEAFHQANEFYPGNIVLYNNDIYEIYSRPEASGICTIHKYNDQTEILAVNKTSLIKLAGRTVPDIRSLSGKLEDLNQPRVKCGFNERSHLIYSALRTSTVPNLSSENTMKLRSPSTGRIQFSTRDQRTATFIRCRDMSWLIDIIKEDTTTPGGNTTKTFYRAWSPHYAFNETKILEAVKQFSIRRAEVNTIRDRALERMHGLTPEQAAALRNLPEAQLIRHNSIAQGNAISGSWNNVGDTLRPANRVHVPNVATTAPDTLFENEDRDFVAQFVEIQQRLLREQEEARVRAEQEAQRAAAEAAEARRREEAARRERERIEEAAKSIWTHHMLRRTQ